VSSYHSLQFRASVNFNGTTVGTNLDFSVQLTDSAGNTSSQPVNNFSHVLFYQPGTEFAELPKIVFNTVRIPLSNFTGINLAKVRNIKFKFNRSSAGSILISDLAIISPECYNISSSFTDSITPGHKVVFTNHSANIAHDSVTWHW